MTARRRDVGALVFDGAMLESPPLARAAVVALLRMALERSPLSAEQAGKVDAAVAAGGGWRLLARPQRLERLLVLRVHFLRS